MAYLCFRHSAGYWDMKSIHSFKKGLHKRMFIMSIVTKFIEDFYMPGTNLSASHILINAYIISGAYVLFPWVITNYHTLGGLQYRNVFYYSSGGQKSEIQVLARTISSEDSEEGSVPHLSSDWTTFLGLSVHHSSVCLYFHCISFSLSFCLYVVLSLSLFF